MPRVGHVFLICCGWGLSGKEYVTSFQSMMGLYVK